MRRYALWKIIFIFSLIATSTCGFVFDGWVDAYYEEVKCEICGKTLMQWVEGYSFYSYNSVDFWADTSQGKETRMGIDMQMGVCKECYEKYNIEYRDLLLKTQGEWLKKKQDENSGLRLKNEEDRRRSKLKQIEEEITELKNKREEYIVQ